MSFSKPRRKIDRNLLDDVKKFRCAVCGNRPCDPAHIRSVGAGGPDEAFNVIPLCRACHSRQHKQGIMTFAKENPNFMFWLKQNGWEVTSYGLWHPSLIREH